MRIERARLVPLRLPLRRPLATARGVLHARQGWLLELRSGDASGWGEASPLPGFRLETGAACRAALAALAADVVGRDAAELAALLDRAERLVPRAPAARAALDCALHDLLARSRGSSVARLLADTWLASAAAGGAPPVRAAVPVNALLGGNQENWAAAAEQALSEGFAVIKLKLGRSGLQRELDGVMTLAARLGGGQRLRLDVNGAWTEAQARQALQQLARAPVEWIEQPLAARDLAGMARLRALGLLPLAADEAVSSPQRAQRAIQARAADWLVIKPAAVGGLRAACRIALAAAAAGLGSAVTAFLDSAIGVASAFHLAAALPGELPAAGLGTSGLFVRDVCTPLPVRGGWMAMAGTAGLGVQPDPAEIAGAVRGEEWRA